MIAAFVFASAVAAKRDSGSATCAGARGQLFAGKMWSPAIDGVLRFSVWLPCDYTQQPKRRYPVLYALHGLPGDSESYRSLSFLVPTLDTLHAEAIVVFPQAARSQDPDAEYADLGPGHNWETALTKQLPAIIGSRYRTFGIRDGRGIIGISAGGYGAMILGLHHLDHYKVIESWSGYFHATTPDGSAPMQFSTGRQVRYQNAHALVSSLPARLQHHPTLIAFFTGKNDPYPGFTDENRRFDRELANVGIAHRFSVYPGGHSEALWNRYARAWLQQALLALTPAGP